MNSTASTIPVGTRVLLPNHQGRTFTYARVLKLDGHGNAQIRKEATHWMEREPTWITLHALVVAREQ